MVSARAAKAARRAKHTPSSIDKLEGEVRDLIRHLRLDKGWTIDEIKAQLDTIGQGHISRSALGRHTRSLDEIAAEMREARVYAEALAKEAGDKDTGELLDMNAQLLHNHLFKLQIAMNDGEEATFSSKETKEVSEALRNLALMRKTELDVIERAEKRAAAKATAEAAEKATRAARSKGLSKDTVEAIRHAVLGSDT